MESSTEAGKPQAIYKRWIEEGEKVSVNLADHEWVILSYYKPSSSLTTPTNDNTIAIKTT